MQNFYICTRIHSSYTKVLLNTSVYTSTYIANDQVSFLVDLFSECGKYLFGSKNFSKCRKNVKIISCSHLETLLKIFFLSLVKFLHFRFYAEKKYSFILYISDVWLEKFVWPLTGLCLNFQSNLQKQYLYLLCKYMYRRRRLRDSKFRGGWGGLGAVCPEMFRKTSENPPKHHPKHHPTLKPTKE
jgi:hypothetical protein